MKSKAIDIPEVLDYNEEREAIFGTYINNALKSQTELELKKG